MKRLLILVVCLSVLFTAVSCQTDKVQKPYYIFVFNSECVTNDDMSAICSIQDLIPEYEVVMVDVKGCNNAFDVYTLLQSKRDSKNVNPSGIQILGTPGDVPAFVLRYETVVSQPGEEQNILKYDDYLSDYFYSNFNNSPELMDVEGFSAEQIAGSMDNYDINPQWPVVRLPLSAGEYSFFVEKFKEFISLTDRAETINISIGSPILPPGWYPVSSGDTNYFFIRARDEWNLIDNLHVYGTTKGIPQAYYETDGSIETENWAYLTEKSVSTIYHDGHGGSFTLMQTVFDGNGKDEFHCEDILTLDNINNTLKGMPYMLFTTGCEAAKDMNGNIITEALSGKCARAFAMTTVWRDVEADCMLSPEEYDNGCTKFTFLYEYIKGQNEGLSCTESFTNGQQSVSGFLVENVSELNMSTFVSCLNNLFGFHNFGIIGY